MLAKTQFSESKSKTSGTSSISTNQNIDYILWIVAVAILFIERVITFRHKNIDYAKN